MTSVETIDFRGAQATMLMTLYGRALQSRSARPILHDPWAEDAIRRVNYDFTRLKVGRRDAMLFAIRATQFDLWTRAFLAEHPAATVLHLGCGMDSRIYRVDPPASVAWFDVDYPEVIELRRRLYPARAGYQMIGSSLADLSWLQDISHADPALIVAEGVTMYLTEPTVKALLNAVVLQMPAGQVAFDAHTPQLIRLANRSGASIGGTGATFHWGIGNPRDIKQLEPRLELVTERQAHQLAAFSTLPWGMRLILRSVDLIPALRIMRCLLYRFERLSAPQRK